MYCGDWGRRRKRRGWALQRSEDQLNALFYSNNCLKWFLPFLTASSVIYGFVSTLSCRYLATNQPTFEAQVAQRQIFKFWQEMKDLKQEQISVVVIYTPVLLSLLLNREHLLGWRHGDWKDDTKSLLFFQPWKRCEVISKRREQEDKRLVVFGWGGDTRRHNECVQVQQLQQTDSKSTICSRILGCALFSSSGAISCLYPSFGFSALWERQLFLNSPLFCSAFVYF